MVHKYLLYYTLNQDLPEKDGKVKIMSSSRKSKLIDRISKFDKDKTKVVLLLIMEHYRLTYPEENIVTDTSVNLPYGGIYKKKERKTEFNIDSLPNDLLWILRKFTKIE